MELRSINPATGEVFNSYQEISPKLLEYKLELSHKKYLEWKRTSFEHRGLILQKVASVLLDNKNEYAKIMSLEMGKPILEGVAEIEKCAFVCNYYALNAEKFLTNTNVEMQFSESYISYQPIGTILTIMPWNFPFWQVFRFVAPTLMAGNTCVLKHSNNTTSIAIIIEEIFIQAGLDNGIFQTLVIDVDKVESVIKSKYIKGVSFTGSLRVGKIVASQAGASMKKSVLELGGSDPYVILDDADLELVAETIVSGRFYNGGQTCISPKRTIVTKKNLEELTNLIVEKSKKWKCSNPQSEDSNIIGPIAREDLLIGFENQVNKSIQMGAKLLLGGQRIKGLGFYYQPTILTNVKKGMPAYEEELFGPAIAILPAEDEEGALRIANDTDFGLGAAVFTKDIERGKEIAEKILEAGAVFVNSLVKSDPRMPFGGTGLSGYGRELGMVGIHEFVNIKTICVG